MKLSDEQRSIKQKIFLHNLRRHANLRLALHSVGWHRTPNYIRDAIDVTAELVMAQERKRDAAAKSHPTRV